MTPEQVKKRFLNDIKEHQFTVTMDNGLHRHLTFKKPESSTYRFDIVTWPGYLAISGDMGTAVFSREADMLQFFKKSGSKEEMSINPQYWQEKMQCGRNDALEFKLELFVEDICHEVRQYLEEFVDFSSEDPEDQEAIKQATSFELKIKNHFLGSEVYNVDSACHFLRDFSVDSFIFTNENTCDFIQDFSFNPEYSTSCWQQYTFRYLWQCFAIAYAAQQYELLKKE